MSDISLYLDQDNELRFNVSIEGSKPGSPKYRLVFEGKDFSYTFMGQQDTSGEVVFNVPALKTMLKEGKYNSNLEVLVGDRYFVPLEFTTSFTQSVSVVAEHVTRSTPAYTGVTASFVTAAKTAPVSEPSAPKNIVENKAKAADVVEAPKAKKKTIKSAARMIKETVEDSGLELTTEELRDLIRLSLKQQ